MFGATFFGNSMFGPSYWGTITGGEPVPIGLACPDPISVTWQRVGTFPDPGAALWTVRLS